MEMTVVVNELHAMFTTVVEYRKNFGNFDITVLISITRWTLLTLNASKLNNFLSLLLLQVLIIKLIQSVIN